MKRFFCLVLFLALGLIACGSDNSVAPGELKTGIIGKVYRGPTQPVCVAGDTCVEPFAATFHVFFEHIEVMTFQTGTDGNFRLAVVPGDYLIVPDTTAPILSPESQKKTVTVPEGTVVTVRLDFDTGIL